VRRTGCRPVLLPCLVLALSACQSNEVRQSVVRTDLPSIRFLLTFDDGPSLRQPYNPTTEILNRLAHNSVQSPVRAVFFVQTRNPGGGGTERGRELLRRTQNEGHVLAVHSGSPRGHVNHRGLSAAELDQSLTDAIADLRALSGRAPTLVRPPYWSYDDRTRAAYRTHGLAMLLTDLTARDGKTWGWTISLRRRSHMRWELEQLRRSIEQAKLPIVDGVVPLVVTFHDTNAYTAHHMQEYLEILVEESKRVGLALAEHPFYDDAAMIERVARVRAETGVYPVGMDLFGFPR
jgi:peptidoglycan/xylan/chitin deacetylase (PgdA/CDA1 family)